MTEKTNEKKTSFITFEGKRTENGCHFSHTEAFGLTKPVIGPILEFLTFKVFYRKWCNWKLIRDDMILDNRYLKDILTEGRYPERLPEIEALSNAQRKKSGAGYDQQTGWAGHLFGIEDPARRSLHDRALPACAAGDGRSGQGISGTES